jgi:hypothetical protein
VKGVPNVNSESIGAQHGEMGGIRHKQMVSSLFLLCATLLWKRIMIIHMLSWKLVACILHIRSLLIDLLPHYQFNFKEIKCYGSIHTNLFLSYVSSSTSICMILFLDFEMASWRKNKIVFRN